MFGFSNQSIKHNWIVFVLSLDPINVYLILYASLKSRFDILAHLTRPIWLSIPYSSSKL
jgi:hypothetical protein